MDKELKNYTAQPDPEVWNKIEKSLHRRAMRRRWTRAGAGVAAIVAAIAVAFAIRPTTDTPTAYAPLVAEATPMPNVASDIPSVEPAPVAQKPVSIQAVAPNPASTTITPGTASPAPTVTQSTAVETTPAPATAQPVAVPVAIVQTQPQETEGDLTPIAEAEPAEPAIVAENTQAAPKASVASNLDDTILWIPNAFTPSSTDGSNTIFKPRLSKPGESVTDFKMAIFNRRGMQVFHTNQLEQGWNGTYNGRPMPQGAYVYIIYYTDKDHLRHQRKGTVTLIR